MQILQVAAHAADPLVARACLLAARDLEALHAVLTRPDLRAALVALLEGAAPRLAGRDAGGPEAGGAAV